MNEEIFQELLAKQARVDGLEAENARLKAEMDDHNKWFVALESYRELEARNMELRAKLVVVENCIQNLLDVEPRFAIQEWAKEICQFALAAIREGESKKPVPGIDFNPNVPSLDGAFD